MESSGYGILLFSAYTQNTLQSKSVCKIFKNIKTSFKFNMEFHGRQSDALLRSRSVLLEDNYGTLLQFRKEMFRMQCLEFDFFMVE